MPQQHHLIHKQNKKKKTKHIGTALDKAQAYQRRQPFFFLIHPSVHTAISAQPPG